MLLAMFSPFVRSLALAGTGKPRATTATAPVSRTLRRVTVIRGPNVMTFFLTAVFRHGQS
jgi:hypothetical protein